MVHSSLRASSPSLQWSKTLSQSAGIGLFSVSRGVGGSPLATPGGPALLPLQHFLRQRCDFSSARRQVQLQALVPLIPFSDECSPIQ